MVLDRSNIGIVGSNTARDMDVCLRFLLLRLPVQAEALQWADPPSKESYQNL